MKVKGNEYLVVEHQKLLNRIAREHMELGATAPDEWEGKDIAVYGTLFVHKDKAGDYSSGLELGSPRRAYNLTGYSNNDSTAFQGLDNPIQLLAKDAISQEDLPVIMEQCSWRPCKVEVYGTVRLLARGDEDRKPLKALCSQYQEWYKGLLDYRACEVKDDEPLWFNGSLRVASIEVAYIRFVETDSSFSGTNHTGKDDAAENTTLGEFVRFFKKVIEELLTSNS